MQLILVGTALIGLAAALSGCVEVYGPAPLGIELTEGWDPSQIRTIDADRGRSGRTEPWPVDDHVTTLKHAGKGLGSGRIRLQGCLIRPDPSHVLRGRRREAVRAKSKELCYKSCPTTS